MALVPVQAGLALSAESTVTGAASFGPGPSITVGSGSDRALHFVFSAMEFTAAASATAAPTLTATFNGATVLIYGYRYHSGDRSWLVEGYLANPPAGAGTLSVTFSTTQASAQAYFTEYTGAHQTTPPAVRGGGTGTSGASRTATGITTAAGSYLVGAVAMGRRTGTPTADVAITDGTAIGSSRSGTSDLKSHASAAAYKSAPVAGSTSVAFSWPETTPRHAWQATEIFAAPGAGGGDTIGLDSASLSIAAPGLSNVAPRAVPLDTASLSITSPGLDIVNGTVLPLSIAELPYDGYVFATFDNATATVILKGKGTTGQTVQARGASAGGNTAWGSAVVNGAGDWTVTLAVSMTGLSPDWYTPEARYGTNDATKVTATRQFGCGKKTIFTGQSEIDILLSDNSFYGTGYTYPTPLQLNVTTLLQTTNGPVRTRKVTSFTPSTIGMAVACMANVLAYRLPGWKFEFIDGAVPGTSIASLQDDTEATESDPTANRGSDYRAAVALAESGGSPISLNVLCWYNSTAGTIKTFGPEWSPFFLGERWNGSAFTLGSTNPDSAFFPSSVVSWCLWDNSAPLMEKGRGVFARGVTKLAVVTPMPFQGAPTAPTAEATNFTSTNGRPQQLDRPARDYMVDTFAADPRMAVFTYAAGSAHICDFSNDIHPLDRGARWGLPEFGHRFIPAILINCGIPIYEPTYDTPVAAPGGVYADQPVKLPNGGTLTTLRSFTATAAPAVEPPHYQPIIGFEVRRAGQTDAQRRPLFKTTETGYPASHRGAVSVDSTGTGTGAARRATIRLTPEVPFVTGDGIEFLRGEASALLQHPRDSDAKLFLDMPMEHIPSLYDATQPYPFIGVPVRPQPAYATLTVSAATGDTIQIQPTPLAISSAGLGLVSPRTAALDKVSMTLTSPGIALASPRTIALSPASLAIASPGLDLLSGSAAIIALDAATLSLLSAGFSLVSPRVAALGATAIAITSAGIDIVSAAGVLSSIRWATPGESETAGTFGEYRT